MNFYSIEFKKNRSKLIFLFLCALFIRLIFFAVYPELNFPDAKAYQTIGSEILSGKEITNNIYMPLYPIWVGLSKIFNMYILSDIFISSLSVVVIYKLSEELFANQLASNISAFTAILYPHFVFYSISGLSETLFIFLFLISILFLYKKKIIFGIIFLIMSVLVKPTFDFFNPIMIFIFLRFVHSFDWRKIAYYLFVYFLIYIFFMAPWWTHQYNKYGEFVRLNLGDGVVLYAGNNPLNKTGGGINGVDVDESIFGAIKDPVNRNRAMKDEAFKFIINNPANFIELSFKKFVRFWRLWPYASEYQSWYVVTSSLLSYGIVLLMALFFIFFHFRKSYIKLSPILATIFYLTIVHMVTIGSIRYRLPLEPFLIILSSYVLGDYLKYKRIPNFLSR